VNTRHSPRAGIRNALRFGSDVEKICELRKKYSSFTACTLSPSLLQNRCSSNTDETASVNYARKQSTAYQRLSERTALPPSCAWNAAFKNKAPFTGITTRKKLGYCRQTV